MQTASIDETRNGAGWKARLGLRFVRDGSVTRLRREPGFGPLYVQKPFYADPPCTHVYVIHPPGGIVGGDSLTTEVVVEPRAHALLTTPAATKVYRVIDTPATVTQRLTVRRDATLEWLPLETIAFNGTALETETDIVLEPGGRCFAWEMTAFGRTAGNEPFSRGRVSQRVSIVMREDGGETPLLLERATLDGGTPRQRGRWGYGGATVAASAWYAPADRALGARVCAELATIDVDIAVSVPERVLTLRLLDDDAERASQRLRAAWRVVRRIALGRDAVAPRIWST